MSKHLIAKDPSGLTLADAYCADGRWYATSHNTGYIQRFSNLKEVIAWMLVQREVVNERYKAIFHYEDDRGCAHTITVAEASAEQMWYSLTTT